MGEIGKRIGLLGGTFNPPHNGHLEIGTAFAELLGLDEVLLMPNSQPPHKLVRDMPSEEDRLAMCRLLEEENPLFRVSTLELERGGKSYTVDTIKALKEQRPKDDIFLIVGADMFMSFHTWYRYGEIMQNAVLCAAARRGDDDPFKMTTYAKEYLNLKDNDFYVARMEPFEVSSTEIRRKVRNGQSIQGLVPEAVASRIHERGLYTDAYDG